MSQGFAKSQLKVISVFPSLRWGCHKVTIRYLGLKVANSGLKVGTLGLNLVTVRLKLGNTEILFIWLAENTQPQGWKKFHLKLYWTFYHFYHLKNK